MHVNTETRQRVAGGLAGTSLVTVSTNRGPDLLEGDLPAAIVATESDEVEPWNKGTKDSGVEELRTVQLTVVIVADGSSDTLDDDMDALRAEIEPAVDVALADFALSVRHTGAELEMGQDEDGKKWFAFLVLTWEVEIVTEVRYPETAI